MCEQKFADNVVYNIYFYSSEISIWVDLCYISTQSTTNTFHMHSTLIKWFIFVADRHIIFDKINIISKKSKIMTELFSSTCSVGLYIIHNLVSNACLSYRIKIETKCLHPTVRFEMFHATDKANRTAVNRRLHDKEKPVSLCIEIVHKIVAYMCTQYTYLRR